jgi:hypothetical protein
MLNVILGILPALGSLVSGGKADAVISAGTKIAKEIFGTTDETAIAKAIETNPALADQFKAKLEAETANLAAQLADVQDARDTTVRLAEAGSVISWGAPAVSVIVVGGFVGLSYLAMNPSPTVRHEVVLYLLGAWQTLAGSVVGYWVGSSAGSANKDVALKQIAAGKR